MKGKVFQERIEVHVDETLDVRGHKCPIPVLRVRRQLERMSGGTILKVVATDAMTQIDFPHFCQQGRHELLEMSGESGIYSFLIRKSDNAV
ncbi:MAG: sulfurtransferase TusA family protein [Emcibacter sp.]|nr:sulfurtransferase TusA family protein [Emcibacter sp.]